MATGVGSAVVVEASALLAVLAGLVTVAVLLSIAVVVPRLRTLRSRDSLTGLPERAQLERTLAAAIAEQPDGAESVAVALIGLDRFSHVNGALGRAEGNAVLKAVAELLREIDSRVARVGGDEFAVCTTGADAAAIGERVAATLNRPIELSGRSVFLGASIGVATSSAAVDAESLVQHADTAMQLVKERGGGMVLQYSDALRESIEERLAVTSALQRAIEQGELVLHYQPIVDTVTHEIVGAEALVRWEHPTLGMIPPDRFIPVAEDTGLIVPLGEWVLEEACRQAQEWQHHRRLRMAVNLSARQLEHERVDDLVARALRLTGLDPALLDVELTERSDFHDQDEVADALTGLRAMGVGCSVDDFGTGFGGLSYLVQLPVDEVKIDRSFVKDLGLVADRTVIVGGVIDLARDLGLRVVAEGVETEGQARFLAERGCDQFQGFLVSAPVPADAFEALLVGESSGAVVTPVRTAAKAAAVAPTAEQLWAAAGAELERGAVERTAPVPAPVRPGPRRDTPRRRPVVAAAVAGLVLATSGTAAAVPGPSRQAIVSVVHSVQDLLPGEDGDGPGRSESAPGQQKKSAEPPGTTDARGKSAEAPGQQQSSEAPGRSAEAPARAEQSAESPGKSAEAPGQQQSSEAPGKGSESPGQQQSAEAPGQQQSSEAPGKGSEAPSQQQSSESPGQQQSVESPGQQQSVEAPGQQQSSEAPGQSGEAPVRAEQSAEAPGKSAGAPAKQA